jgi:hypothetical protein
MKAIKILFSTLVMVVLAGVDQQAAGEDGLQYYGLILRGLVWLIILVHGLIAYENARGIAAEVAA